MAISVSFTNVSARIPSFHENNIHTYLDVAANVLGKMFGGNDWMALFGEGRSITVLPSITITIEPLIKFQWS